MFRQLRDRSTGPSDPTGGAGFHSSWMSIHLGQRLRSFGLFNYQYSNIPPVESKLFFAMILIGRTGHRRVERAQLTHGGAVVSALCLPME